mmetsp:Transcript_2365/g.3376  ORF Transcript_2365/g.3376 Transcript_2365/m.3376 type:complete len:542 (+) Transcript_2365:125-1750(+)|eukprot:CAMPEP_0167755084 /NCGR_PEP_ID=MMETSP0110_2-20121227/8626_1 /TAXON_ID=629695 /ORGANISM="Gymnochlora sp., Strain CCMP2014" /LENGTH=541 /DNA_ID=CAMNT_0007641029 /DNA_START=94 /DNA_END=1719 /DNA_ORIENTATION=-
MEAGEAKEGEKKREKIVNPVTTQPGSTNATTKPPPPPLNDRKGTLADKKNPMTQLGHAFGNLWSWAKEKSSKLRKREPQNAPKVPAPIPFKVRLDTFKEMLTKAPIIDKKLVIEHAFTYGAPETPGYRSILWKLLLGYLPYKRTRWKELDKQRELYREWVQELITNPYNNKKLKEKKNKAQASTKKDKKMDKSETKTKTIEGQTVEGKVVKDKKDKNEDKLKAEAERLRLESVDVFEDPLTSLSKDPNSRWEQYFQDENLRQEIHKDIMRTYSSFSFFLQRVHTPKVKEGSAEKTQAARDSTTSPSSLIPSKDEIHHDVIQRILFIYAKLNPGVRYVQGMNEILAPIYFTFAQDPNEQFRTQAEADAFFCFSNLMTEIRDRFIRTLDCTSAGIIAAVKDLNDLLAAVDKQLYAHLRKLNIDPRFYAFRWLTLLLSQEFELPDTLRLWDTLFADEKRFEHLTYCCCSMLILYRNRLLEGGFAEGLRMLQDYPPTDLHDILALANKLRNRSKFKVHVSDGQQLVRPIDLDAHLGLNVRRRGRK